MSLTVKKFDNKDLNITLDAYVDNKQNIWFKGKDVATLLRYKDTDQSIRKHVDSEDTKSYPVESTGQVRKYNLINESGLYSLTLSSKLETAKMFKRWVTKDVLPSIRKYGYYRMFNNPNTLTFKIEDEYEY